MHPLRKPGPPLVPFTARVSEFAAGVLRVNRGRARGTLEDLARLLSEERARAAELEERDAEVQLRAAEQSGHPVAIAAAGEKVREIRAKKGKP